MSKMVNGGLDQYGAEPFEQQQFEMGGVNNNNNTQLLTRRMSAISGRIAGTGVEGVNIVFMRDYHLHSWYSSNGKTKVQRNSLQFLVHILCCGFLDLLYFFNLCLSKCE